MGKYFGCIGLLKRHLRRKQVVANGSCKKLHSFNVLSMQ
jgi:hypothetical protein